MRGEKTFPDVFSPPTRLGNEARSKSEHMQLYMSHSLLANQLIIHFAPKRNDKADCLGNGVVTNLKIVMIHCTRYSNSCEADWVGHELTEHDAECYITPGCQNQSPREMFLHDMEDVY